MSLRVQSVPRRSGVNSQESYLDDIKIFLQPFGIPWLKFRELHLHLCGKLWPPLEYQAVSYRWSDATPTASIVIDGSHLKMPSSDLEGLRAFRVPQKPRFLWLDALCINQKDFEERESRVPMMGDIYANATETIIWLGRDSANVREAIRISDTIWQRVTSCRDSNAKEMEQTLRDIVIPDVGDLSVLDAIFNRPWFSRVWVYQEVLLSRRCVCYMDEESVAWERVLFSRMPVLSLVLSLVLSNALCPLRGSVSEMSSKCLFSVRNSTHQLHPTLFPKSVHICNP